MQRFPVQSSVLESAGYDPARRWLDVEFRSGLLYRYFQVPSHHYQELMKADSKGIYFNEHIRDRFPYQPLSRSQAPIVLAATRAK